MKIKHFYLQEQREEKKEARKKEEGKSKEGGGEDEGGKKKGKKIGIPTGHLGLQATWATGHLQGYLAHAKTPTPLGPP